MLFCSVFGLILLNLCCIVIKQSVFAIICLIVLCLLLVIFSGRFLSFGGASLLTINANNHGLSDSHVRICSLVFTWLFGLITGYSICKPYFLPLMRSVFFQPVSIVGLFVCIFLPLFLSFVFILFEKPVFLLTVCFIKSAAYGFSCGLLSQLFHNASWLMRILFLFSDSCFLLVLLALWLKCFPNSRKFQRKTMQTCIFVGILICLADYCVVSPLFERLF